MRFLRLPVVVVAPLLLLGACATEPMGPSVGVMPAVGKPFEAFEGDQTVCKQFADGQVQDGAQNANARQIGTSVVTTLLGAGLGGAIGGGRGAAIGAGAGALGGTALGAGASGRAQNTLQQRYDLAYTQCMYARGNQVPSLQTTPTAAYAPSYQPSGYQPSGYQPSGFQPGGYQPAGYQPGGAYPSGGYPRSSLPPQGYAPPGYAPTGYPPAGYPPPPG